MKGLRVSGTLGKVQQNLQIELGLFSWQPHKIQFIWPFPPTPARFLGAWLRLVLKQTKQLQTDLSLLTKKQHLSFSPTKTCLPLCFRWGEGAEGIQPRAGCCLSAGHRFKWGFQTQKNHEQLSLRSRHNLVFELSRPERDQICICL